MKTTSWVTGLVLGCLATSCGSVQDVRQGAHEDEPGKAQVSDDDDDDEGDENEQAIALDQVPAEVKQAAQAAVPGFVLKSAETETEEGSLNYCLEGTAGGEAVEVEVRASDNKVVEIERGEDEDEDD
jgi:hypothetical protein